MPTLFRAALTTMTYGSGTDYKAAAETKFGYLSAKLAEAAKDPDGPTLAY